MRFINTTITFALLLISLSTFANISCEDNGLCSIQVKSPISLCENEYTPEVLYNINNGDLYLRCIEDATEQDNYTYVYNNKSLSFVRSSDIQINTNKLDGKFFSSGFFGSYPVCSGQKEIKSDIISLTKVPNSIGTYPYCYMIDDFNKSQTKCTSSQCRDISKYLLSLKETSLDFQALNSIEDDLAKSNSLDYVDSVLLTFFDRIGYSKRYINEINNIAYFVQKNKDDYLAISILKNVISKYPTRTVAYLNIADSEWNLNERESAIDHYKMYVILMKQNNKANKIPRIVIDRIGE